MLLLFVLVLLVGSLRVDGLDLLDDVLSVSDLLAVSVDVVVRLHPGAHCDCLDEAGHPMLVAGEIDTNSQEEAQDQAGEQRTLEHKDNWVGFKSSFMFHEG